MKDHKHDKGKRFDHKGKGNFPRENSAKSFSQYINPDKAFIKEISLANKGSSFSLTGSVDKVVQTGGPTIFYISDGTGTIAIKAFEKAGVRAHPHVEVGDIITVSVRIDEFNGELEGEVVNLTKLSNEEKATFQVHLTKLEMERAKVTPPEFLAKSVVLDKLKDRFIAAATNIRLAIFQNRPIIVRHHNDADGYSSGYALEKAILPLIQAQHSSSMKAEWEFYTRAPCNAPMYEIDDSIRDTAHSLSNVAKFSNKMPLVIIADTGSGEEDLLAIQQGRVHGIDFIVIDHHQFERDVISAETLVHINPFLVGENGATFSAGMLCTELARFINSSPDLNIGQIPAMAGMADRINNPEVMREYLEHAAKIGYNEKLLADIATVIDFISSKLRFMEAREYIEVLFGEPMEKQKKLVALLAPYIRNLESQGLEIAETVVVKDKVGAVNFLTIEIEKVFPRGFYPKPGRCISMVHDNAQEKHGMNKLVTMGVLSDAMTIRATDGANFSVPELVKYLNKKLPEAYVNGGGHKNAGSIKFLPHKQPKVLEAVKEFIKKNN